jgi:class 3 adenylate cyclase
MAICPSCSEENPTHARFCLACGTALEAAHAGEERKVVSVRFVDLVGFTAGADGADPEDVRATLRPYHARVTREIERFGGTVEARSAYAQAAAGWQVFGCRLEHALALHGAGDEAKAAAILGELGVASPPAQTAAARTAK